MERPVDAHETHAVPTRAGVGRTGRRRREGAEPVLVVLVVAERDERLVLAPVVPAQPVPRHARLDALGQDALLVLDGQGAEDAVGVVERVPAADLGERRRRQLLRVADDDDAARPAHRPDGVGDADLRRLVEHDKVEQVLLDGEEPGEGVRAHEHARQHASDEVAVRRHEAAHPEPAALSCELAPERTDLPDGGGRVERSRADDLAGDRGALQVTDRARRRGEPLDGVLLDHGVEPVEPGRHAALASRRERDAPTERVDRGRGVDGAEEQHLAGGEQVGVPQRLERPDERDPAGQRHGVDLGRAIRAAPGGHRVVRGPCRSALGGRDPAPDDAHVRAPPRDLLGRRRDRRHERRRRPCELVERLDCPGRQGAAHPVGQQLAQGPDERVRGRVVTVRVDRCTRPGQPLDLRGQLVEGLGHHRVPGRGQRDAGELLGAERQVAGRSLQCSERGRELQDASRLDDRPEPQTRSQAVGDRGKTPAPHEPARRSRGVRLDGELTERQREHVGHHEIEPGVRGSPERGHLVDEGLGGLAPAGSAGVVELVERHTVCRSEVGERRQVDVMTRGSQGRRRGADVQGRRPQGGVDRTDGTRHGRDVDPRRVGEPDEPPGVVGPRAGRLGGVREQLESASDAREPRGPRGVEQVDRDREHRPERRAPGGSAGRAAAEREEARARRVEGQPRTVRRVQPLRVPGQGRPGGAQRLELGLEALLVDPDRVVERSPDLGTHGGRLAALVVQVERERPEAHLVEPRAHDVEGCALLGDEQDPLAVGDSPREQVRDGLRLAGPGGALEHEGPSGDRVGHRRQLGRVRRHRAGSGELVEVGAPRVDVGRCRGRRVDERVGRRLDQVPDQRVRRQHRPVLVEVLPQPVLRELEDREVDRLLDPVPETFGCERRAHREQRRAQVDSGAVLGGLGETGHGQAVHLPQLLEQAVVGGAGTGLVELEAVRALPRPRHEADRDQHEGRAQLATVEGPHERAERDVEVVGPGLLDDRACLVREGAQPAGVRGGRQVGEQRGALVEQLGALVVREVASGADPARHLDLVELVRGEQVDRVSAVQRVLDGSQVTRGDGERDRRPRREVEEPVAQGQVEQGVLPLPHARGHGRDRGYRRGGELGGGRWCATVRLLL